MLPSFHEGLTLSVIEAMHFGLPCVVSDVRGNKDLIVNNKGGFVYSPNDSKSFADGIYKLYQNKSLLKRFGAYNKKQSKKYEIANVIAELDKIYDELKFNN